MMYAFHMHIRQVLLTIPPVALLPLIFGQDSNLKGGWLHNNGVICCGAVCHSQKDCMEKRQHHSWLSEPCMAFLPGFGHNQEIYGVSPGQNCAKVLGTVEEVHERQQLHLHSCTCELTGAESP
jgi:hypothetical protein